MAKIYAPDISLLVTWDNAEKFKKYPVMAVYEFDNRHLIYVGTLHNSKNYAPKTFDAINYGFVNFNPDCVVTEIEHSCKNIENIGKPEMSELAYSAYVAQKKNIPYVFADTNIADQIQSLEKISHDKAVILQTMRVLSDAMKYKKYFSKPDTFNHAFRNLGCILSDLGYEMSMSPDEFKNCCRNDFGYEVSDENISDILENFENWSRPDMKGGLTNKIWAELNLYSRDPYMIKEIFNAVNKYGNVLVTMGAGHFEEQRFVFEKAFGKAKYIYEFPESKRFDMSD